MCTVSSLQIIALSRLATKPMTGYDLSKQLPAEGWHASHQQIYRDLTKAEKLGLVTIQYVPQEGKPDKKIYSITSAGKDEIRKALKVFPSIPKLRDDAVVQVFIGNVGYFVRLVEELFKQVETLEKERLTASPTRQLIIDRLILRYEADIQWAKSTINTLEKQKAA